MAPPNQAFSSHVDARSPASKPTNIFSDNALLTQVQQMESRLANNMIVEDQSFNNPSPPTKKGDRGRQGVMIHVNKYIPHYQRIPQNFSKKDFKLFEFGPDQDEDSLEKIRDQIHEFDKVLIDTLMIDREQKYN